MSEKWKVITITWCLAMMLSLGLHQWGVLHPTQFLIRPFVVIFLLIGPILTLAPWIIVSMFKEINPQIQSKP